MADVTGDFGGQPIQLNNAATEATLKQLLANSNGLATEATLKKLLAANLALVSASAAGKKGAKIQKELEEELKKLSGASKDLTKIVEGEKGAREDNVDQIEKEKEARKELAAGLEGLYKGVESLATGMIDLLSTIANVGNSMTSAASAMSAIPVVGGVVSKAFGAVAAAAEKSTKSFQAAASSGATFNGSITSFKNSANAAGMTMDDFGRLISQNGESLRLLGGTTESGAKRFANISKTLRTSSDSLYALGYTTEDVNQGLANYTKYLGTTGKLGSQNDAQLIAGTKNYLKEMDALAKITGETRKDQEDARAKLLNDAQFQAKVANMGADAGQAFANTINGLPPGLRDVAKDIMVTGTATTEESQKFMAMMPRSAELMQKYAAITEKGGKLTQQQQDELRNTLAEEGKAKKLEYRSLGMLNKELSGTYMQVTAASTIQEDAAKKAAEQQKRAADGTDAMNKRIEESKQALATFSNNFSVALAESGLLDKLVPAFQMLADFTSAFLLPAFNFVGENATLVGTILGGVAVTLGVMNAIVKIGNTLEAIRNIQLSLSSAGLGKLALGLMATSVAMLPLTIAAIALYAGWKMLTNAGWSLGDVLEAMGDNLKRFGLSYVDIWLSIAEKVAKFFGGGDKITAMRQQIALEQSELDEKEKARDQRRKQNREEAAQKEKEMAASKKLTESKEAEIEKTKESVSTGVDYNDSLSVLRNQMKSATSQPGASSVSTGGPVSMPSQAPADIQKYLQATALVESGGNANARAGTSSAGGMFQFIDSTWKQMTKEMGKDYTLQDKFDPKKSAEVMAYFTQKQKAQLEKGTGRQASNTDLYMAHFLGSGGATKFLNAMQKDPSQSAAAMDPAAAKANKSIYYTKEGKERSLQEVYALMGSKIGKAESAVASGKWGGKAIPAEVLALGGTGVPGSGAQMAAAKTIPTPVTPTSGSVPGAVAQAPQTPKTGTQTPGAVGATGQPAQPPTTQESAESLLASLNNKMDQLIKHAAQTTTNTYQQVVATNSLSGDLYKAV